jgi:hypothetical protein
MSFFFGSAVKKSVPAKVFVPQNKPKVAAPVEAATSANEKKDQNETAAETIVPSLLIEPSQISKPSVASNKIPVRPLLSKASAVATATSANNTSVLQTAVKATVSQNPPAVDISIGNQSSTEGLPQGSKKRNRSDSSSSIPPSAATQPIEEKIGEELSTTETVLGANKARKRRKVTAPPVQSPAEGLSSSVPAISAVNNEISSQRATSNSSSASMIVAGAAAAAAAIGRQSSASSTSSTTTAATNPAIVATKRKTAVNAAPTATSSSNNNRNMPTNQPVQRSTASSNPSNNSSNNAPSSRTSSALMAATTKASLLTKAASNKNSASRQKLERPLFPVSAFGDVRRFTRHTVYVRLPAPGLNGIEGIRLSNIDNRAVVTAIQPMTDETPRALQYLQQIEMFDVILAVNHLDARYATFAQILTALGRTQSAPVAAQDTYVLDDGTQVTGRDLLLTLTQNPNHQVPDDNSKNSDPANVYQVASNSGLDPLGAGLGLGSVGSGVWALLHSQASLNGIPGVLGRGTLKNATIDSIARVVVARMPRDHVPSPAAFIAHVLEQQQQPQLPQLPVLGSESALVAPLAEPFH